MNFIQSHVRTLYGLLFCLLLPALSQAQIMFERTYGGSDMDYASCILQTADGGYLIAGSTSSFGAGGSDIYVIKTDAFGDTLWTKTYGGGDNDYAATLNHATNDGYIIAGYTKSYGAGASDGYIIRIDWLGDTLWSRTMGGNLDDNAYISSIDDDGGFITLGTTYSFCASGSAIYVNKHDSSGNVLWTKVYQKFTLTSGGSSTKRIDGHYYILGSTDDGGGGLLSKLYLIKINNEGDTIWTSTYDNPGGALKNAIIDQTPDDHLVISGRLEYLNGEADLFLMKLDFSGIPLWFNTYGGSGYQGGGKFAQTSDGGFILTGVTGDAAKMFFPYKSAKSILFCTNAEKGWINGDLILIKTDSTGDSLWSKTYGGSGEDAGATVQQTDDNGYIACGLKSTGTNEDVYLIKTDFTGVAGFQIPENEIEQILISPNPSNGKFHVSVFANNAKKGQLEVLNCRGQLVLSCPITMSEITEIDVSHLEAGLYFIHINGCENSISKKIIILK